MTTAPLEVIRAFFATHGPDLVPEDILQLIASSNIPTIKEYLKQHPDVLSTIDAVYPYQDWNPLLLRLFAGIGPVPVQVPVPPTAQQSMQGSVSSTQLMPTPSRQLEGEQIIDDVTDDVIIEYLECLGDSVMENVQGLSTNFSQAVQGFTPEMAEACLEILLGKEGEKPVVELMFAAVASFSQVRANLEDYKLMEQFQEIFGFTTSDEKGKDMLNLGNVKCLGALICAVLHEKIPYISQINKKSGNPFMSLPFPDSKAGNINKELRRDNGEVNPKRQDLSSKKWDFVVRSFMVMISKNKHTIVSEKREEIVAKMERYKKDNHKPKPTV